jgi:hypothetical protein
MINYEEQRTKDINKLTENYGTAYEQVITKLYDAQYELLEQNASVTKFLPLLAKKTTKKILKTLEEKGQLEKLLEEE